MPELVAIDLPGGEDFVDELKRVWDAGHAALPVDQRLPAPARSRLLAELRPSVIVDGLGTHRLGHAVPVEPGDALVVATSGSTGNPKGVVLTHAAIEASARASSRALEVSRDDHWLACLPLAHIGGLSVVTRALIMGTPLTVIPHFDQDDVKRLSSTCSLVSLVSTALRRIDPAAFRLVLLGGSSPPPQIPDNVVTTYGSTETGSGIVYDGHPLEGVEIEIADDGEILVRGPMLMREYRDGSTSIDANGWLHTDDEGSWLPDGRLHVLGRRGDVIVTGGEKVWPENVERVISGIVDGGEFCLVGIDDDEWGSRVVLATTRHDLDLGDIREHVRSVLPVYCAPHEIYVVDDIPRTALGKAKRSELRELLMAAM